MQNPAPLPTPARPPAHDGAFALVCVLVVLAAGVSIYLELKIRAAAAQLARLETAAKPLAAVDAPPGRAIGQAADANTAAPAGRAWGWVPDKALLQKEWKQAVVAGGYDRPVLREAANHIRVRLRFHELYRLLGLSPAEIAIFEKEASAKNLTFTELVSPNPADHELHKRGQERAMARIVESTLGREYVEPFQAFLVTSDLRNVTSELAGISLGSGETLEPAQAAALLQASMELRLSGDGTTRITADEVDWEAVSVRAQGFLSPNQQQLFRALVDRRKFLQTFTNITGLPVHRPIRKVRSP